MALGIEIPFMIISFAVGLMVIMSFGVILVGSFVKIVGVDNTFVISHVLNTQSNIAIWNSIKISLGDGPIGQVIFTGEKVIDYRSVFRSDRAKGRRFMLGLFEKGMFLNPLGTKLYISLAHSDNDIDAFLERSREVLKAIEE